MVPEHRKAFTGQATKLGQAILLRKRSLNGRISADMSNLLAANNAAGHCDFVLITATTGR
jgi:hypothetical protein